MVTLVELNYYGVPARASAWRGGGGSVGRYGQRQAAYSRGRVEVYVWVNKAYPNKTAEAAAEAAGRARSGVVRCVVVWCGYGCWCWENRIEGSLYWGGCSSWCLSVSIRQGNMDLCGCLTLYCTHCTLSTAAPHVTQERQLVRHMDKAVGCMFVPLWSCLMT